MTIEVIAAFMVVNVVTTAGRRRANLFWLRVWMCGPSASACVVVAGFAYFVGIGFASVSG